MMANAKTLERLPNTRETWLNRPRYGTRCLCKLSENPCFGARMEIGIAAPQIRFKGRKQKCVASSRALVIFIYTDMAILFTSVYAKRCV